MKIYLASPFFNDEQIEREERVKAKLRQEGFEVFSPREYGIVNKENKTEIFLENVKQILHCQYVFCITDTKDMGTIWEAGFAYGVNKRIIYYCETLKGGNFNVMLAESANMVITEYKDLDGLKKKIEEGKKYEGNVE